MKIRKHFINALLVTLLVAGFAWGRAQDFGSAIRFSTGRTPQVTIGNGEALDTYMLFDGNAQDFYLCLDDSADDLVLGYGSVCGTTGVLNFDASGIFTTKSVDATTNAVTDIVIFDHQTTGTVAAGFGSGVSFTMEDLGGSEQQASIDAVFTTATDAAEDADIVFSQNDNGTVRETLRLIADDDGTVEGTRMQFTSTSAETNGINDLLVLKASGGTTVVGFGVGIDLQAEFADGVETAGKISAEWTDVATGTEDADIVLLSKDAGGTAETFRFTSDGELWMEGTTDDGFETILAPTDPSADATITVPNETGPMALFGTKLTSGSGTGVTVADSAILRTQLYKVTVDFTQFDAAAVTHDLTIATMPAKTVIHTVIADVTTAFVCASVCTTATLSSELGVTAGANEFLESFDIDAAIATFGDADAEVGSDLDIAGDRNGGHINWAGTTIVMRGTSGTGNWGDGAGATNLNAGSITFYILYSVFP